eukprot:2176173-Rhodomonas_salina.1
MPHLSLPQQAPPPTPARTHADADADADGRGHWMGDAEDAGSRMEDGGCGGPAGGWRGWRMGERGCGGT